MSAIHSSRVDDVLRRSAARSPHRPALAFGDRSWTYRELDDAVTRAAAELLAKGVGSQERVAVYGSNSDAYVIAFLACSRAGLVHVPINNALTGDELDYLLTDSGASLVLADPGLAPRVVQVSDVPVMALRDSDESLLSRVRSCGGPVPEVPEPDVDESGLVQLLYTSGTTSAPKGAMMSHRALVHEYFSTIVALDLTGNDAPLHVMPLYHSAGMHVWMMPYLAVGAANQLMPSADVTAILEQIEETRAGSIFLAPTVWVPLSQHEDFARRDLSSLRKAIYGASIMPVPVLERLQKALPQLGFYNAFGQSEIGPLATVLRPEEHARHPGLHHVVERLTAAAVAVSEVADERNVQHDELVPRVRAPVVPVVKPRPRTEDTDRPAVMGNYPVRR